MHTCTQAHKHTHAHAHTYSPTHLVNVYGPKIIGVSIISGGVLGGVIGFAETGVNNLMSIYTLPHSLSLSTLHSLTLPSPSHFPPPFPLPSHIPASFTSPTNALDFLLGHGGRGGALPLRCASADAHPARRARHHRGRPPRYPHQPPGRGRGRARRVPPVTSTRTSTSPAQIDSGYSKAAFACPAGAPLPSLPALDSNLELLE